MRWIVKSIVTFMMACLLLVALSIIAGSLEQAPPTPARHYTVYERTWPDQELRDMYNAWGFHPYPQIGPWRLISRQPPPPHIDEAKMDTNLWTPQRVEEACRCTDLAGHMSGVPPGWGSQPWHMIQIDIEAPYWTSIRAIDKTGDEAQAGLDKALFFAAADALRERFPGAMILTHHMMTCHPDRAPKCAAIEQAIAARVDGNCPSMYIPSTWALERSLNSNRLNIRKNLLYKADHPTYKVFPIVAKRYRNAPRDLLPVDVSRAQIETILDCSVEGPNGPIYVDGIVIWHEGPEGRDHSADLAYARIIAEELDERD